MYRRYSFGIWTIAFVAIVLGTSACSDAERFYVDRFDISHVTWDSIRVDATFGGRPVLGPTGVVRPDSIRFVAFDSAFDTLYVGIKDIFPIPDVDLGDEESILVEVCGRLGTLTACSQETLTASPKRVVAGTEINYPLETGAYDRGAFDVSYDVQRQQFDEPEAWQMVHPHRRPETWFQTYMDGFPHPFVRIPVTRASSRFNIGRFQNFRDLRFGIESSLLDTDSAQVRFDLYARLGHDAKRLDSSRLVIRSKTQEERRSELDDLLERAGNQLLDEMKGFFGVRKGYIFVNEWTYHALERAFEAEFELHWQDSFRGEWSDLTAELNIKSDGSSGTIQWTRGSDAARKRWEEKLDGDIYVLKPLFEERIGDRGVGNSGERRRRR